MKLNFKRVILFWFIFTLFIAAFLYYSLSRKPLNLLIISVDTLRPDHMGIYGYSKNTTPEIDKWAKDATVFTNATTVVPMTYPSFTALMTGKDPFHTRIIVNGGLPLSSNTPTIATILKNNGYKTGAFVTNAVDLSQGFEEFNTHLFKIFYQDKGKLRFRETSRDIYERFIESSQNWLSKNRKNKFFLWVHLMDPHEPYYPPQDLRCKFDKKYCGEISGKTSDDLDALRAEYESCQKSVPADRVGLMETLYDGEAAAGDRIVGRILDSLKRLGLDKNTVVVFYGDHGEGFDHNYYFNHREVLYNSAVRIPLIIKTPFASSLNTKTNALIQNTDIAPTLLDTLGINYSLNKFDGKSFSSQLTNPFVALLSKNRDYSYSVNSTWTKFSISDGAYKYIYSLPETCLLNGKREELYDLKTDPLEKTDLSDIKPKVKDNLKTALFNFLSSYNLPIEKRPSSGTDTGVGANQKIVKPGEQLKDLRSLGY